MSFKDKIMSFKDMIFVHAHSQAQTPGTQQNMAERMEMLFENLQKRMEKRRSLGDLILTIPGATAIACQVCHFKLSTYILRCKVSKGPIVSCELCERALVRQRCKKNGGYTMLTK